MKRSMSTIPAVFLIACMVVLWTVPVSAATTPHRFSGKATHTGRWCNWGKASTRTSAFLGNKTVVTTQKQKGQGWYTPWYATTDNHRHVKGEDDLSHIRKTSTTHQVSASVDATIKGIGAKAGYSFSRTTGSDITTRVARNAPTGYYYYACRAAMIDLKQTTTVMKYKKKGSKWKLKSKSVSAPTGAMIRSSYSNTGLYYEWRKR